MIALAPDQVVRAAITAEVAGDRDLAAELLENLQPHELLMVAAAAIGTSAALVTEQAAAIGAEPTADWTRRALEVAAHI